MKSEFLGLRTVIYSVSDLEKAKEWYSNAFHTKPYFDEPTYVGFSVSGYELGLVPSDLKKEHKTANVETLWGVPNVEQEHKRLINLGCTELNEPTDVGGDIIVSNVKDPWGNVIGLIYNLSLIHI